MLRGDWESAKSDCVFAKHLVPMLQRPNIMKALFFLVLKLCVLHLPNIYIYCCSYWILFLTDFNRIIIKNSKIFQTTFCLLQNKLLNRI